MRKPATSLVRPGLILAGIFLVALMAAVMTRSGQAANFATLTIPEFILADEALPVVVPVVFDSGTADNVNTFVFDIRYDAQLLALDTTDGDNNDIPDSIHFNLPIGFSATVDDTVSAGTGSLFTTIVNVSSPLVGMPNSTLMEITFVAGTPVNPTVTNVTFASDPAPFFADKKGKVISGVFDGGSVAIGDVSVPTATATKPGATVTATSTTVAPTSTVTATAGPSPTAVAAFYMPAVVYAFTPTATPSPTAIPPTATATATATSQLPTATATGIAPPATATSAPSTQTPQPPTPTPGPFCGELILNGGMENDSGWLINVNAFPASYVSGISHSGARSMRIGIVNYWENRFSYSSVQQTLTLPQTSTGTTLRFWLLPTTTGRQGTKISPPAIVPTELSDSTAETLADDVQMVLLFDQAGNQHVLLFQRVNFGGWAYYEMNLNQFIGQQVTLYFGVFNNGTGGITGMYLDDVSLTFCN